MAYKPRNEAGEQSAVVAWAALMVGQYPELELLFSIPNGAHLAGSIAQRAIQVNSLKSQGLRPGVPDLCLPIARGGYHSLFIEMKDGDNKPSEKQERILNLLADQGNLAVVCWSAEEAIQTLVDYLTSKELSK